MTPPTPEQWTQARDELDNLIGLEPSIIRVILNSEYEFQQMQDKAKKLDTLERGMSQMESSDDRKSSIGEVFANIIKENKQLKEQVQELQAHTAKAGGKSDA